MVNDESLVLVLLLLRYVNNTVLLLFCLLAFWLLVLPRAGGQLLVSRVQHGGNAPELLNGERQIWVTDRVHRKTNLKQKKPRTRGVDKCRHRRVQ